MERESTGKVIVEETGRVEKSASVSKTSPFLNNCDFNTFCVGVPTLITFGVQHLEKI